jgi:hypothetical protein
MCNLVDSATLAMGLWEFKFSLSKVFLRLLYVRRRLLSAKAGAEVPTVKRPFIQYWIYHLSVLSNRLAMFG